MVSEISRCKGRSVNAGSRCEGIGWRGSRESEFGKQGEVRGGVVERLRRGIEEGEV